MKEGTKERREIPYEAPILAIDTGSNIGIDRLMMEIWRCFVEVLATKKNGASTKSDWPIRPERSRLIASVIAKSQ